MYSTNDTTKELAEVGNSLRNSRFHRWQTQGTRTGAAYRHEDVVGESEETAPNYRLAGTTYLTSQQCSSLLEIKTLHTNY